MPKVKFSNAKGLVQLAGGGEVNLSGDFSLFGYKKVFKSVTSVSASAGAQGTTTLTAADSGKVIVMSASAAAAAMAGDEGGHLSITLPSAATGLNFLFINGMGPAADRYDGNKQRMMISQSAATEDFVGTLIDGAGSGDTAAASNTVIVFDTTNGSSGSAQSVPGDWVHVVSQGDDWLCQGNCDVANAVVFED